MLVYRRVIHMFTMIYLIISHQITIQSHKITMKSHEITNFFVGEILVMKSAHPW